MQLTPAKTAGETRSSKNPISATRGACFHQPQALFDQRSTVLHFLRRFLFLLIIHYMHVSTGLQVGQNR